MINTLLFDYDEVRKLLFERMELNEHWIILGYDDFSRGFIQHVEEDFYMNGNNDDFDLLLMHLPNGLFMSVAMGHKKHMTSKSLYKKYGVKTGTEYQNVIITMTPETQQRAENVTLYFHDWMMNI